MASQILEVRGRGPRGSMEMAHLVDIGAHDGRGGGALQSVKIKPNLLKQYRSWFAPGGLAIYDGGNPLIAQIYFPFGDATIDSMTDRVALDHLIACARFTLGQNKQVEIEFVGYADPRGAASFNMVLARKRAQQVRDYVERGVNANAVEQLQHFRYKSKVTSLGEAHPTGDYKSDRRVDVVLRSTIVRQSERFDPLLVPGDYKGPLTRKLQFRGYAGVSVGLFDLVGVEFLEIEIRNPRTGRSAFYAYVGGNVGSPSPIPIGVGLPDSGYTDKEIPVGFGMVDIDDFGGPGGVVGASAGKSGSTLIFCGPKLHHTKKLVRSKGWEVFMDGWSVQFPGGSAGGGYWFKLPWRSAFEREKAITDWIQKGPQLPDRHWQKI